MLRPASHPRQRGLDQKTVGRSVAEKPEAAGSPRHRFHGES